ncbi:unnamed protein product [Toxocara canis]|uniref:Protein SMG9 n=1 Tax=Toxocara canis TaxID=6265 RepID=A0A183UBJ1_TOXCA|nr:unnamed protein product [Toxocara canis]
MAEQSRGRLVRAPREYFNAPRYGVYVFARRKHDFYEEAEKVTVLSRPVSILTKPKEPVQNTENVRILQPNPTARPTASPSPSSFQKRSQILEVARGSPLSQVSTQDTTMPHMKAAIRLIGDNMEFTDYVEEYLSDSNTNFTVIGAIGPQGTGKSTLLSMIAGNDHQDMYRHYAFRPASREAVESCRHQSSKISIFVTKSRLILLDCQASFSTAILDEMIRNGRRGIPSKIAADFCESRIENHVEIESIQLISFMMQVCHTILLCWDWFIDIDVIRLVRASEMLRSTPLWSSDNLKFKPNRTVNLVVVHQRAKAEDFEPEALRYRGELLKKLFADSKLNVEGPMNLASMGHGVHKGVKMDVNYVPLADMKPRAKPDMLALNCTLLISSYRATSSSMMLSQLAEGFQMRSPIIDYEFVLRTLRINVQRLPKDGFTVGESNITEKRWFVLE